MTRESQSLDVGNSIQPSVARGLPDGQSEGHQVHGTPVVELSPNERSRPSPRSGDKQAMQPPIKRDLLSTLVPANGKFMTRSNTYDIRLLWTEFKDGINGLNSIEYMEKTFGTGWRNNGETKFFLRRKASA